MNEIDNKINIITNQSLEKKFTCLFCNKIFSSKRNTVRHIESVCIQKKLLLDEKNKFNQEKSKLLEQKNKLLENKKNKDLELDMQEMKDMMKKMMEKLSEKQISQNITVNNNNNNTQNNLVIINPFGKEDLSHITIEDYKKYLNTYFKGFTGLIEKIYFDESVPGNHNICINNIKSPYMYVYENNNWQLKDKSDIIDNLINNKYILLNEKCDELEENNQISEKIVNNFKQFTENYNNDEAQKNTKKDVMLMIYNNKDKIKDKVLVKKTKIKKQELLEEYNNSSDDE